MSSGAESLAQLFKTYRVDWYRLKKLHRAVEHDVPEVRSFFGAWREMREIRRRQQREPGYQFDTPVPSEAGGGGPPAGEPEAASVGELAPRELR